MNKNNLLIKPKRIVALMITLSLLISSFSSFISTAAAYTLTPSNNVGDVYQSDIPNSNKTLSEDDIKALIAPNPLSIKPPDGKTYRINVEMS